MESYNLKTAAGYINNLLLARGLLRNGKPIEFAHPSRGEGGKEQTMAQIINLVHDLILKRDRDQEYRESVAETIRNLRSETTRQTLALEKIQTRNDDLSRQSSLAQSQERSARAALRTAESSARSLKEEMLRLKTTVSQIRTSCANDVRKRDVQIQRLKSHLTTQQRGNKTGLVGASITINPGSVGLAGATSSVRDMAPDLDDPEYSLKQETTEFLTQLSQSLSDENDNLISLVRSTLLTLKELQGMSDLSRDADAEGMSVIGEEDENARQGMLHALPTNYETLASDMDTVLDNLKNLLTNPNFVAVDEVEMREEEIHRLRAGWEQMEARLREAFMLMDSWRKRMNNGDTINLEELKMGLGLGAGLQTMNREDISMIEEDEEEDEDQDGDASSVFDDEPHNDLPSPEKDEVPETTRTDMFKLKLQPALTALRETNGNKSPSKSPRKVAFSASIPNTPTQLESENADASVLDLIDAENTGTPTPASKIVRAEDAEPRSARTKERTPRSAKKRHSSPHDHPEERSPKLTVHDKLAQAEAAAAAVADGLQVSSTPDVSIIEEAEMEQKSKKRAARSPIKSRIQGRPKRRKSTLTPEELDNLLNF